MDFARTVIAHLVFSLHPFRKANVIMMPYRTLILYCWRLKDDLLLDSKLVPPKISYISFRRIQQGPLRNLPGRLRDNIYIIKRSCKERANKAKLYNYQGKLGIRTKNKSRAMEGIY